MLPVSTAGMDGALADVVALATAVFSLTGIPSVRSGVANLTMPIYERYAPMRLARSSHLGYRKRYKKPLSLTAFSGHGHYVWRLP